MSRIYTHTNVCVHDSDADRIEVSTYDQDTLPNNPLRHRIKFGESVTIHLTNATLEALRSALVALDSSAVSA